MVLTRAAKKEWLFIGVMKAVACDNMGMGLMIQETLFVSCVFLLVDEILASAQYILNSDLTTF